MKLATILKYTAAFTLGAVTTAVIKATLSSEDKEPTDTVTPVPDTVNDLNEDESK